MKNLRAHFVCSAVVLTLVVMPSVTARAQSITFDLTGFNQSSTNLTFGTEIAGAGFVTSIDYNFNFTSNNGSWLRELQIELVGANASANTPFASGGSQPAWQFGDTFNAGTLVWGTPHPEAPGFAPMINIGGAGGAGTLDVGGSTDLLNNWLSEGTWTLNMLDSWNDGGDGSQGVFNAGSFVTVNYAIPEPTTAGLGFLALLGMVGSRRRR